MADPFIQEQVAAVIAEDSAISAQVDLGGYSLVGIVFPANWSAAGLSFQSSCDGGNTWGELLDETATAISVGSVTGEAFVAVDPTIWRGVRSIKVRSGSNADPVAQAQQVSLTLLLRAVF